MAEDFDIEALLEAPYNKGDFLVRQPPEIRRAALNVLKSCCTTELVREGGDESNGGRNKENGTSHNTKTASGSDEKDRRDDKKDRKRSRSRDRKRSRSKDKKRSRSRDKKRSRSRERKRSKSRDRRRSKSRDKKRSRSRDKRRSRSRDRRRKRSLTPILLPGRREPFPRFKKSSPPIGLVSMMGADTSSRRTGPPPDDLSPEERDARTVFCMQLSQRIRARDLEEFFSSVGKVRDVRMITCNKTRRFKGIAYIEFKDPESVNLALGLNGQKLLGVPIIVQQTQAEKNRAGNSMPNVMPRGMPGPMRLYIGSLHFNITEDMLRGIFEPFGKIDSIQLMTDGDGRSKGYGFITFHNCEDAKRALEQLNGFELAGRPMKVGTVTERTDLSQGPSMLDNDELDRSGIDLGATGRLHLMFKLAEGTGMQIPPAAASALNVSGMPLPVVAQPTPPIATQCFMLSNMFDPLTESQPNWDQEVRDDVIQECNKHGGVLHVYVDKASPQGNVYVKCPNINTAVAAVNSLHGRWFAGRVITAAYVPLVNYHSLFPDTIGAMTLLAPIRITM